MRSSHLAWVLFFAGCASHAPHGPCAPVASWGAPAYRCEPPPPPPVAIAPEPPPPPPPAPPPAPEPPPRVEVSKTKIELHERVQFQTGSAVLLDDSKGLLDEVAKVMVDHPELKQVQVAGHTDSTSTRAFNQALSERRAAAVRDYLVAHGVAADRLVSKGFGQDQPIASNDTDEGRTQNRRVELNILERSDP